MDKQPEKEQWDARGNVIVGVSGSIAAYKAPDIVTGLKVNKVNTKVVMTENGTRFIDPRSFKDRGLWGMWENESGNVPHIELADWCDAMVVAPATANIIGKFANGIADDLLSSLFMAISKSKPVIIYPTMNTNMLESPAVQLNLRKLAYWGYDIQVPDYGMLQCGISGLGKMPKPRQIVSHVLNKIELNRIGLQDIGLQDFVRPMFRSAFRGEKLHDYLDDSHVRIRYTEQK